MANFLDVSTYNVDHPYFMENSHDRDYLLNMREYNKKRLGMFKDEIPETERIMEVIALKPKMYSLRTLNIETGDVSKKQTAKGVPRGIVHSDFSPSTYKTCLETGFGNVVTFNALRNDRHQIYFKRLSKIGLSAFQDKSYQINSIETVPYGHYYIEKYKEFFNQDDNMLNALIDAIRYDENNDDNDDYNNEDNNNNNDICPPLEIFA